MGDVGTINQELRWGGAQTLPPAVRAPVAVGRARYLLPLEEAQPGIPRLTVENIASWDKPSLIRELVAEAQDPRWNPSPDEVKALVCVMARDQLGPDIVYLDAEEDHKASLYQGKGLPWPPGAHTEDLNKISDGRGYLDSLGQLILSDVKSPDRKGLIGKPYTLRDDGDSDPLAIVLSKIVPRMRVKDRVEIGSWLLDNMSSFERYMGGDSEWTGKVYPLIFDQLDWKAPEASLLGQRLVRFIDEKIGEEGLSKLHSNTGSSEWWYGFEILYKDRLPIIYRGLISGEIDEATEKRVIGLLMRGTSVPEQLSIMRAMLDDSGLTEIEIKRLEKITRSVLGVLTGLPVYTKLNDLYTAIPWESTVANLSERDHRARRAIEQLQKYQIPFDAPILDLACGTGELSADLIAAGYTDVLGLDNSPDQISKATKKYGKHFEIGSWDDLSKYKGKFKVVICEGRSLPHAEVEPALDQAIQEIYNIGQTGPLIEDSTLVLISMPNPECGEYWDLVKRYRSVLKSFGFKDEEVEDIWYIVDGPAPGHYYNRIVPPKREMISRFIFNYFAVIDVARSDIPTGPGNEEFLYVLRMVPKSIYNFAQELSKPAIESTAM